MRQSPAHWGQSRYGAPLARALRKTYRVAPRSLKTSFRPRAASGRARPVSPARDDRRRCKASWSGAAARRNGCSVRTPPRSMISPVRRALPCSPPQWSGVTRQITRQLAKDALTAIEVSAKTRQLYDRLRGAGIRYDANAFHGMALDLGDKLRGFRAKQAPLSADVLDYVRKYVGY